MKVIEAIVKSFGGSVVFTLHGKHYRANISFPEWVSQEQEIACAEKVAKTVEKLGGEVLS